MGNTDRMLRLIVAAIFTILFFTNAIAGIFGIILLVVAGVFVVTSVVSFCPLYTLVGLNTCPAQKS